MTETAWYVVAGILLALGVYLVGYGLFKISHREDEYMDQRYLEALWLLDNSEAGNADRSESAVRNSSAAPVSELFDQDEPFQIPTTWPVICRQCEAPLRLEEITSGAWSWKHRSAHLDLQHRPDAVPAVTP
jgi:hypothetical protein